MVVCYRVLHVGAFVNLDRGNPGTSIVEHQTIVGGIVRRIQLQ